MRHLKFEPCLADPDVWMRPAKKADGTEHYEFVLLYVDDALCISENAENILRNEIGRYFKLKEPSIGPPRLYLGGHMRKITLENGVEAWSFSLSQYVKEAVNLSKMHILALFRVIQVLGLLESSVHMLL